MTTQLQIARENKNRFDAKTRRKEIKRSRFSYIMQIIFEICKILKFK